MDIPEFLRIANKPAWRQADVTMARRKPQRRSAKPRQRYDLPKSIEPAGWLLLKQIEQSKKERQAAKFAALRERTRR